MEAAIANSTFSRRNYLLRLSQIFKNQGDLTPSGHAFRLFCPMSKGYIGVVCTFAGYV